MSVVKPNESDMWPLKYVQRPDEPLVFKRFNSVTIEDGIMRRVPHSAFVYKRYKQERPREH
jgi:hypothetical protein